MKYIVLLILICSCSPEKEVPIDDKVYITIEDRQIELVSDEYENLYLKQNVKGSVIYIPYTFHIEEEEIPRVYEAKNNAYVK